MLIAVTGRADKTPDPTPRPETAFDRYEAAERKKNTNFLYEKLGIAGT